MNNKVVLPIVTIDELAVMIKIGFDEVHSEFRIVHKEISLIKADIVDMKKDIVDMKADMATKDDIHELESQLKTTDRTVYKDHAPRLRKLEHSLAVA